MTTLRLEAKNLIDEISEENLSKAINFLKNLVQSEDNFYSEENQKYLQESIREFKEGKVVTFSDEEWEKFINAQNIQWERIWRLSLLADAR